MYKAGSLSATHFQNDSHSRVADRETGHSRNAKSLPCNTSGAMGNGVWCGVMVYGCSMGMGVWVCVCAYAGMGSESLGLG